MMKHGFIYEWTNINTGKKYIGSHIGDYNDGYIGSGKYFRNAYNKNPELFERRVLISIFSCEINEDIRNAEETILSQLNVANSNSYYNISNKYFGGNVYSGLSESDKLKFRKKCSENSKPPKNYNEWYMKVQNAKYKECYQFTKDGIFIQKFSSAKEASEYFNCKKTSGNLSSVCKGYRNYWKGYRWSYTEEPNPLIPEQKTGRKLGSSDVKPRKERTTYTTTTYNVYLIDGNDSIINIFNTPAECASMLKISKDMLIAHLNGRVKHVNGMKFKKGNKIKLTYNKSI